MIETVHSLMKRIGASVLLRLIPHAIPFIAYKMICVWFMCVFVGFISYIAQLGGFGMYRTLGIGSIGRHHLPFLRMVKNIMKFIFHDGFLRSTIRLSDLFLFGIFLGRFARFIQ